MARTVQDAKLESRTSRQKLAVQHKPHYKLIDSGCHIGYRKGVNSGKWSARYYVNGKYKEQSLGIADDTQDADDVNILSFSQAQTKARAWYSEQAKVAAGIVRSTPLTVEDAATDYLEWYKLNRKAYSEAKRMIDTYILPELGKIEIAKLTSKRITQWLGKLATTPPQLRRSKSVETIKYKTETLDADGERKRKATANRIFTSLKALLNRAYEQGSIESDHEWKRVKPFGNVDVPKVDFLSIDECVRLVNSCPPLLRLLVKAALHTGCRYSELARLTCADYNAQNSTIHIQISKNGKQRHVMLNNEGKQFFTQATAGRKDDDIIFLHDSGTIWGKSYQSAPFKEAATQAKITRSISFHILRHTHASHLAMHGTSLSVIAKQLGHSDTRTCERHYAHLCPSYVADTIRANLPALGGADESNVVVLPLKDAV